MKKWNFTFLKDMLSEDKSGKYSSKKLWGHIVMGLVCTTYILDGWDFYVINTHLFDSMLIAGGYLLGISLVRSAFNRTKKETPSDDKA